MPSSREETESIVDESGSDNEDEDEFEIEAILDHSEEVFKDCMGFWVKWKNYDSKDNSWVKKADAGNAQDMIEQYMQKVEHEAALAKEKEKKKKARKSVDSASVSKKQAGTSASTKGTASSAKAGSASAKGSSSTKKTASSPLKSESKKRKTESEEVESDTPAPRSRDNKNKNKNSKRQKTEDEDEDEDMSAVESNIIRPSASMQAQVTWEHLIKSVDTVERDESEEKLYVYFTAKDQTRYKEESHVCGQKFPKQLLSFYETNLRWRAATAGDES